MKSVLISMQGDPNYLIESGKKTLELRKTRPLLEPPFKVYIYEALGYRMKLSNVCPGAVHRGVGRVTSEFICDDIDKVAVFNDLLYSERNSQTDKLGQLCLTIDKVKAYLGEKNLGYIWHVSDLKIYDEPRALSEFGKYGFQNAFVFPLPLRRPPQSWMYVEELK